MFLNPNTLESSKSANALGVERYTEAPFARMACDDSDLNWYPSTQVRCNLVRQATAGTEPFSYTLECAEAAWLEMD